MGGGSLSTAFIWHHHRHHTPGYSGSVRVEIPNLCCMKHLLSWNVNMFPWKKAKWIWVITINSCYFIEGLRRDCILLIWVVDLKTIWRNTIYYLPPSTYGKRWFPNTTVHRRGMFAEHLLSSVEHSLGNPELEEMRVKEEKF